MPPPNGIRRLWRDRPTVVPWKSNKQSPRSAREAARKNHVASATSQSLTQWGTRPVSEEMRPIAENLRERALTALRGSLMTRKTAVPTEAAKPSASGEIGPNSHRSLGRRAASALIAVGVTASTVTAALWTAAIGRFFVPPVSADQRRKVRIGRPAEFAADSVDPRFAASLGVWIVCETIREGRRFTALRTRCTHLGCITTWRPAERMFKCPCHGSGFRFDGINVEGPAPRPLERCAIALNAEGELEVDLSRTFRAEQGQWTDPASFLLWKPPS